MKKIIRKKEQPKPEAARSAQNQNEWNFANRIKVDSFKNFRQNGSQNDQTFDPYFLYGSPNRPGMLYRMRWEHPMIKSYSDAKRNAISNLSFGFAPKDNKMESITAAYLFDQEFRNMKTGTLASWVADTYDYVSTYGSIIWFFDYSEDKKLRMIPIESQQISSWSMDEYGVDVDKFYLHNNNVLDSGIHNFAWIGKKRINDDYRGASELRSLADIYAIYMEDTTAYVAERRLHKGILYMQPIPGETPGEDSYRSAEDFMVSFYQGQGYPPVLPPGFDLKYLQASSPAIMVVPEMIRLSEDAISKALQNNINAMTSGGSFALGSEVNDEDREHKSNSIDYFLQILNGDFDPISKIFERMCTVYGINPQYCPRLVALDNTDLKISEIQENLTNLLDSGVLSPSDVTSDDKNKLLEEMGLNPKEEINQEDTNG